MSAHLDFASVILAASYLTLVVFSRDHAIDLMAPYAVVMLVLTIVSLLAARR